MSAAVKTKRVGPADESMSRERAATGEQVEPLDLEAIAVEARRKRELAGLVPLLMDAIDADFEPIQDGTRAAVTFKFGLDRWRMTIMPEGS